MSYIHMLWALMETSHIVYKLVHSLWSHTGLKNMKVNFGVNCPFKVPPTGSVCCTSSPHLCRTLQGLRFSQHEKRKVMKPWRGIEIWCLYFSFITVAGFTLPLYSTSFTSLPFPLILFHQRINKFVFHLCHANSGSLRSNSLVSLLDTHFVC